MTGVGFWKVGNGLKKTLLNHRLGADAVATKLRSVDRMDAQYKKCRKELRGLLKCLDQKDSTITR